MAEKWTNTSPLPSSLEINPNPFFLVKPLYCTMIHIENLQKVLIRNSEKKNHRQQVKMEVDLQPVAINHTFRNLLYYTTE